MVNAPTNKMKRRLNIGVFTALIIFTICIIFNLCMTAIVKADFYRLKADSQQINTNIINANRGTIYDANGKVLAQSATVWTVFISPDDINKYEPQNRELIASGLAEILDLDYDTIIQKSYKEKNQYEVVKKKVEKPDYDKVVAFIAENKIISVNCVEDTKRFYPNDSLASNIIGFTNFEGHGQYGLEAYYDDYLSGTPGKILSARDANGDLMPYRSENKYDAIDGNSLVLTIDEVLQHYLEKNLEITVSQHKVANRCCGIVMNVKTGAILAMASSPSYNLNDPTELLDTTAAQYIEILENDSSVTEEFVQQERAKLWETQWKNKAITELYFPGSVFKVITCSSALEEELVSLNDSFTCNAVVNVAGTTIHCWRPAGHGTQDLTHAMVNSCNPAFINIGQRLGVEKFTNYFKAYGFTERTGIDLPGEAGSLYVKAENMGPVELASSSFGQTNKITPLQMITAYAAVVNGGKLVTPYVVEKILDNEGNVIKQTKPSVKRQVISEETSVIMRGILETVVSENGGNNAYIQGYKIGGKSGTSQKIDKNNETGGTYYVSSFVGFAPADDPEVIMLVMVDEPTGGQYYGSAVAAPVVSAVFKEGLPYLGIYPQYTAEEQQKMDCVVPYLIGLGTMNAEMALSAAGLSGEIIGNGSTIIKQMPANGNLVPRNGKVIIYTEDIDYQKTLVPNVIGMSVSDVNKTLTNAGLNVRLAGGAVDNANAKAVSQSQMAGNNIYKGMVIEVSFVVNDETG